MATLLLVPTDFEQAPEDALFPACVAHNVGVIVRVPLDEGGLTGRITPDSVFDPEDFRNRYFAGDRKRDVFTRAQAVATDLAIPLDELPEVALRFALSQPAVSTVIPGMRSVRNAERNTAVGDGKGLPSAQVAILKKRRWIRNFYEA